MMGAFEIIYLISTILQIYAIYRYMTSFYAGEKRPLVYEGVLYLIYYVLITSVFLVFRQPLLTVLVNLVMIFLISWRYGHSIKKAITSTLFVYVIMILVEAVLGFIMVRDLEFDSLNDLADYANVFGVVVINIANYALVMAISKYMSARQGIRIPFGYWLLLMLIPTSTIYMVILVYQSSSFEKTQVIIFSALLLMINFVVLFLYDMISHYFDVKIKEASLIQLNKSYARQFEMMERSNRHIRAFRHDYKKHMNTLKTLLGQGSCEQASAYVNGLTRERGLEKIISQTGNIVIDSIINYELNSADEYGVDVEFYHNYLPMSLEMEDYDMTIVLSNLLSNALESVVNFHGKKVIRLNLNFDKGVFYVKVVNTYDGLIDMEENLPTSRKKEQVNHGIGLSNVKQTVEKYDGSLRLVYDDQWFAAEAVMYMKLVVV